MYRDKFKSKSILLEKLEVDNKGRFMLESANGKKIAIELSEKEIETIENWRHLYFKHPIRFDIRNILELFDELNITQISKMVEQSKSTVARHLKLMEDDGLIVSRINDEVQKGKIPPRLYSINRKLTRIIIQSFITKELPKNPKKLIRLYEQEIQNYRSTIYEFTRILNLINPLLNHFEDQLGNVGKASKIHKKYFDSGKLLMWFDWFYISEKYYDKFFDLYAEYFMKRLALYRVQYDDPEAKEKDYIHIESIIPAKEYLKIYQKTKKANKHQ